MTVLWKSAPPETLCFRRCHRTFLAFFQSALSIFLAILMASPVSAIPSDAVLDFYHQNGIYYYDPTGHDSNCVANTDGSNITIIGDSITYGVEEYGNHITKLLPNAKVYAQVSKQFGSSNDAAISASDTATNPTGFSIAKYLLAEGSLGSTVVYALGSNNPALTSTQVNDLISLLGSGRTIFFVTNYDANNSSKYNNNNNILKTAAENANVHIIDWATSVSADPARYLSDGLHPTEDGRELFASLIDKAVGGSTSTTAGANGDYTNYAGDRVLTDKAIEMLEANIPIYQQAIQNTGAASYGITWQLLAAIHYKEHSFSRTNPSNGQGIWQLYDLYSAGMRFPATSDPVSEEEFLRQTELAITGELVKKIEGLDLDLTKDDDIKKFFFAYNGMAGVYKNKALAMGYSQYQADIGEGSPYVMNGYDAARDPFHPETMNSNWRGAFVADGEYSSTALSYTYGAFTLYEAMGGATFCANGISSGGLTLEQAKAFMNDYIYNVNCSDWGVYCTHTSVYGPKANCVTFTQYFISRFTSAGVISPTGDGGWVVSNLTGKDVSSNHGQYNHTYDYSSKGFQYGGSEPRPFAIFSTWHGKTPCGAVKCGHTGVVLGIDEASNKIYIGQAGYDTVLVGYSDVVEKSLSDYTNGDYWFAYTDSIVNTTAISEVIGG